LCSKKNDCGCGCFFSASSLLQDKTATKTPNPIPAKELEQCLESFITPVACQKILWKHVDSAEEKKPEYDSPDNQVISCLIADVCSHCNKKFSSKGEVLQCDLCGQWVHASCESIKRDQYCQVSQLAAS